MSDFEVWVYRGAIVILLGILWYLAKGVLKELRLIREFLQVLQVTQGRQDEAQKNILEHITDHKEQLADHEGRLRAVEKIQNSCTYCQ